MSEVTVTEAAPRTMIALRGDFTDDTFRSAVVTAASGPFPASGIAIPEAGSASWDGARGILWMSPDELFLVLPLEDRDAALALLAEQLAGIHHMAVDVSDARAALAVEGAGLRDVLAKLTPADMAPGAFAPGHVRRTRLAQIAAALWMQDDTRVEILCFRSVTKYAHNLLLNAAESGAAGFHHVADT